MLPLLSVVSLSLLACAAGRRSPPLLMAPPHVGDDPLPPDQWYTQQLDHFDASETRTWQQRYQVNDSFYQPGGPVFLMIGGEGPASAVWLVSGTWIDYAQQYGALCFQLEHRFYGDSLPTEDMSVENLRYLSSEQALADLAAFSAAMTEQYALPEGTKWVSFGGSYPGSLSAWYRLKYPHMVHAAVSTSAPLLAKTNFFEYLEVVNYAIHAKSGDECYGNVELSFQAVEDLLQDAAGWATLTDKFKLCSSLDGTNSNDVSNLMQNLADLWSGVVQYNEDNFGFRGGSKLANITINTLCDIMNDAGTGSPLDRLVAINDLMMDAYEETCLDFSYDSMIAAMRDTDFSSANNTGMRQWIYQTCTEFGWYQTTESADQPFGSRLPLPFSIQQCVDVYGAQFEQTFIDAAVAATNTDYGARQLPAKRVVLVNGSIDPWHAMGIIESSDPDRPAIFINGTAHCANMYPAREEDLPGLTAARQQIGELIGKWLQED
ncbi:putative serine protease K12H4.7 [Amphibalanus amphitrite]|uniref:putative serine protease K12H4.7 n=1 Tax=Amphibalanus amphitrite TaxID=1232801 RepID=UPI001C922842|nr:putative serine protease K12H4.7 [Amphibalanus amphitrite]